MGDPNQPMVVYQQGVNVSFDQGRMRVCAKNKHVGSNGLWYGDNPFEFVLPVTLFQIIMVIAVSRLFYFVLRPLRTPRFVCSVLGGVFLGPSVLGRYQTFREIVYPPIQAEFLGTASTFGASYFIFLVALKMDVTTTLRAAKSTWRFGVIPFLSSLSLLTSLLFVYYDKDKGFIYDAIKQRNLRPLFSAVLSFSNFIVISEALMELKLATSELGQIALSSAMLNDTMQWFTLLLTSLVRTSTSMQHSFQFLICYWVLIFFFLYVIRPAMLMIAKSTPEGKPVKEVYIVLVLAGVLVMAALSDLIGLSFLQGPLLFGLIMPNGPPLGTTLIQKCEVVLSEFLLPFFFAQIGISTNWDKLKNWEGIAKLQFIILAGYLIKTFACMVVGLTYNIRLKHGLVIGLILNIKGIVELMTFTRMERLKMVDEQGYTHLVFSVLVMTAIITPLIKILYKPHARLDTSSQHQGRMRTIQDTLRNSEFSIISCVHNDGNVHSIVGLLEACHPNLASPICAYVIHFIELLGKSTPFLLPVEHHRRRKSFCINYPNTSHIIRAFENYADNSNGLVTVLPYVNVAPYKHMHESICNLVCDKMVPFLIIPFHENGQTHGSHMTASIRDLNTNFQIYSPCTVGILVDRYLSLSMITTELSFHVGIFFIGGPDDREALSLGIRMSERENMKITLFWFIQNNKNLGVFDKKEEEEDEGIQSLLDESFIDEFKANNIGNDNVVCKEIRVDDGIGVLEAIRGLEGNYDLVMVGRRHNMKALNDEEMTNFMENVEILGMLGDMLASTEFCNGMVPVLVTQCGGKRYDRRFNRVGSFPNTRYSLRSFIL